MKREMGRSWLYMLGVCVLFLGPTIEGCAQKRTPATSASSTPSAPTAAPLASTEPDPSRRIAFGEFSVLLPQTRSWQRGTVDSERKEVLGFGTSLTKAHMLVALISTVPLNKNIVSPLLTEGGTLSGEAIARAIVSRQVALQMLVDREKADSSSGRLRLTSFESDFESDYIDGKQKEMTARCARYDVVFEDRGDPLHPGTAVPRRAAGLMCIPLATNQVAHIVYDERRLPDETPLATFDAEARAFFDSLQFTGNGAGPS